jgi:hypothetical protein
MSVSAPARPTLTWVAAGSAAATAVLYLLIAFGVAFVGRPTTGESASLFEFGVVMATVSGVVAALLVRFRARPLWIAVGVLQAALIVGYFVLAEVRDPQFEPWGLTIKALQVVVLTAVALLALRR